VLGGEYEVQHALFDVEHEEQQKAVELVVENEKAQGN
jgi:uncharacterized protein YoaH (UPF0181 family)